MRTKNMIKFFGAVVVIIAAFVTLIYPLASSIKQGLDLQGGTHIVLEAEDTPDAPVTEDSLSRAVTIVERRINEMGLTEPIVQKEGARRIIVELPGEKIRKKPSKPLVRRLSWNSRMNRVRPA